MHCELVVPGLLPALDAAGTEAARAALGETRFPSLELLLARARKTSDERLSLEAWLAEAFGEDADAEIPAGALAVAASGGAPGEAAWMRADPAHLRLNRDELVLVPASAFGVRPDEAQSLTGSLNGHFSGQLAFEAIEPDRWCVRLEGLETNDLRTETPTSVAGRDINRHLPSGTHPARWHALLNEIQMVLHAHPVNEAREGRGEPPVNSVWLWGAGRAPSDLSAPFQSVTADDPTAIGYASVSRLRHRPLGQDASQWLDRLPEDGRQLIVVDTLRLPLALGDLETWRSRVALLERAWFAPLLNALRSGRIGMVTVVVPDGEALRAFESTRNDLRHFWRRPTALARYL